MIDHLARCRAVVFPPFNEDYGFVTVEAFMCGKPVITCSDSGGPAELVRDGESGFVTEPTPEALAAAMRALVGRSQPCRPHGRSRRQSGAGDDLVGRRAPAVALKYHFSGLKLSVVMPAYNEQATIRTIVARVLAVDLGPIEKELVIVDDGSKDGTRDILKELDGKDGVRVFFQPHNQGKGAAVWRGMRESTGDMVIIQDADLEIRPARVFGQLLRADSRREPMSCTGRAFSARLDGTAMLRTSGTRSGNRMLTMLSNMFSDLTHRHGDLLSR